MSMSKTSRMLNLIDYRIKVILQENRVFIGTLMAFDKHMNLVLGDCEERRKIRSKNPTKDGVIEEREEKMVHGLVLLRGENIITIQIESPPPQTNVSQAVSGPGKALAVGRGLTSVPLAASSTLTGPLRGLGGPDASTLTPQNATAAPSMPHPRNMMPNMPGVPGMPGMMPPRGMMPPNGMPGMPGMMPPRGMMPPNGMPGMPGMMPPRGMMPPNGMPGMPPRP